MNTPLLRTWLPIAILAVAIVVLLAFGDRESIGGLRPDQIAGIASLLAILLFLIAGQRPFFQGAPGQALQAIAFWAAMGIMLMALYSCRDQITGFGSSAPQPGGVRVEMGVRAG